MPFRMFTEADTAADVIVETSKVLLLRKKAYELTEIVFENGSTIKVQMRVSDVWKLLEHANEEAAKKK